MKIFTKLQTYSFLKTNEKFQNNILNIQNLIHTFQVVKKIQAFALLCMQRRLESKQGSQIFS